jgi:hypothetical protein
MNNRGNLFISVMMKNSSFVGLNTKDLGNFQSFTLSKGVQVLKAPHFGILGYIPGYPRSFRRSVVVRTQLVRVSKF